MGLVIKVRRRVRTLLPAVLTTLRPHRAPPTGRPRPAPPSRPGGLRPTGIPPKSSGAFRSVEWVGVRGALRPLRLEPSDQERAERALKALAEYRRLRKERDGR